MLQPLFSVSDLQHNQGCISHSKTDWNDAITGSLERLPSVHGALLARLSRRLVGRN